MEQLRINTSTHYAIRIILHLAEQGRIVSSTKLSSAHNISQRYLMQIIAKLRDGGLIGTFAGMSGGYTLLNTPASISLYDIIVLVEGGISFSEINISDAIWKSKLDSTFETLNDYVETYLRSITLDQLIGSAPEKVQSELDRV